MFRSRVSVLVGLLSLILVVVSVSAQRAVSYNTISEQEYLQLQESISSAGTVPVIVELAVPGLVDTKGELDLNGDMQAQGQAIATTQQQLLDELSGYNATPYYEYRICLLYTSDAADERSSVDLGGRRIIKKKKKGNKRGT